MPNWQPQRKTAVAMLTAAAASGDPIETIVGMIEPN
jgi:hypothetical protein